MKPIILFLFLFLVFCGGMLWQAGLFSRPEMCNQNRDNTPCCIDMAIVNNTFYHCYKWVSGD